MDRFTERTRMGFGERIMKSFLGVLIGIILFFASFFVLFSNEGRVNLSNVAKESAVIENTTNLSNHIGDLVSVTGNVTSDFDISDLYYVGGNYIVLSRSAEAYAWEEIVSSDTTGEAGGSSTTTSNYDYKEDWVTNVVDSSRFRIPAGHINIEKRVNDRTIFPERVEVGDGFNFSFNQDRIGSPETSRIDLNSSSVLLPENGALTLDNYIYIPLTAGSDYNNPKIGDVRISYSGLESNFNGTVIGKLNNNRNITQYTTDDSSLGRLFIGDRGEALQTLDKESQFTKNLFRFIGFLMMWIGLSLVLGPISVLFSILPALGSVSRFILGLIALAVAFILSLVTIIASIVFHNVIFLIITIIVVVGLLVFYSKRYKK